jgi:tRNA(adenine34) deaminase
MDAEHERFMQVALEEAEQGKTEGNIVAVGAVITHGGVLVERGHNLVDSTFDVTAHAETATIRKLSTRLRKPIPRYRSAPGILAGHALYTTVEPCAMCAYACCAAGISTVVIGARFSRLGVTTHGEYAIEKLFRMLGQDVQVISDVLYEECAAVYRSGLAAGS